MGRRLCGCLKMTKIKFIQSFKELPETFWERNLKLAYNKAKYFPENYGSGPFLRGEGSENHIIRSLSEYDNRFSKNLDTYSSAPDCIFSSPPNLYYFDVKMKLGGFEPGPRTYFKSKTWDFKKTQSAVSEFKTDSDFYLMIDPINFRVALCDSNVLKGKKFKKEQTRINFSIKPNDVTMIYDGHNRVRYSPNIKARLEEVHDFIHQLAERDLVLNS